MKSFATLTIALCLMGVIQSRAAETNAPTLSIGAAQAAAHIGKQVTVTGVVAQVSVRPGLTFLNFDKAYPNNAFTAIVRSRNTNQFENLPALKGKGASVTGKVTDYNGKPEMELTKKSQLKVLEESK